jgi:hypothetical protein
VIGSLATALKTKKGTSPRVYVEGGTAHFRVDGILSWNSLTFFERAAIVLFKSGLWHLWGDAPSWWGWVRLRARTVHTALDARPRWKGHPTRLFAERAHEGESVISPTFDVKVAWADNGSEGVLSASTPTPALFLATAPNEALREVLADSEIEGISLEVPETEAFLKKGKALFTDDSPSNVLLAAYLTMQGVPVLAHDAPLLKAVLGFGGYIVAPPDGDDPMEGRSRWTKALNDAMSEAGRSASASARRFLKENYTAPAAADSLEKLYRSVMRRS